MTTTQVFLQENDLIKQRTEQPITAIPSNTMTTWRNGAPSPLVIPNKSSSSSSSMIDSSKNIINNMAVSGHNVIVVDQVAPIASVKRDHDDSNKYTSNSPCDDEREAPTESGVPFMSLTAIKAMETPATAVGGRPDELNKEGAEAAVEEGTGEMEVAEEQQGYAAMRNPHYWQCVEQYRPLFEHFGATKVSRMATTRDLIKNVLRKTTVAGDHPPEEPFFVMDLSRLVRQYTQWKQLLPRVHPFYAVKCNDSPIILQVLGALGVSFDCASKQEIDAVLTHAGTLATGPERHVDPASRIIFANPCKQVSHCRHAANVGVQMTTVDNEYELKKLKKYWPDALVIIRIKTDDSMSICQFSTKFGANVFNGEVERLIQVCKELDLNLHGVSFHVGSGCQSAYSFVDALLRVRKAFDIAATFGYDLKFVDIGGGFPGIDGAGIDFIDIANTIRPVMDELFDQDVEIIAEPGRYFACASYALVCNVFAKRDTMVATAAGEKSDPQPEVLYYINDGLYGSFNCIYFDHVEINLQHLPAGRVFSDEDEEKQKKETRLSTVFGPTCDSIDKVVDCKPLPDMDIGDYVFAEDFGAYTYAAASAFNGFKTNTFHFFWRN